MVFSMLGQIGEKIVEKKFEILRWRVESEE
jgi:hypothetical protein